MRKSKAVLFVLALVAITASAPQATDTSQPPSGGARLAIPETTFDFGYTPQHTKVSHVYWLKNTGTDTLRLTDVRPGCGCTKAPLKKKTLPPGDSTDVEVIFSTGVYKNQVHKTASVIADLPGSTLPVLEFTASPMPFPDSLKPLTFSPALLDLDSLRKVVKAPLWDYNVSIRNHSDHDLQIRQVLPLPEQVKVDLPKGSIGAGKEIAVRIRIDPAVADSVVVKSLTFEASDSAHTRYTLPIVKETRWGPAPKPSH